MRLHGQLERKSRTSAKIIVTGHGKAKAHWNSKQYDRRLDRSLQHSNVVLQRYKQTLSLTGDRIALEKLYHIARNKDPLSRLSGDLKHFKRELKLLHQAQLIDQRAAGFMDSQTW